MKIVAIFVIGLLVVGCSNSEIPELVDESWSCHEKRCDISFKVLNNSYKERSVQIAIVAVIVGNRLGSTYSVLDEKEIIELNGIDYFSFMKSYSVKRHPTFIQISMSNLNETI